MRNRTTTILVATLAALAAAPRLIAQDQPGGDELALFSDLPVVVSASRSSTSLGQSAAAVTVLTSDEIHALGRPTVAETLAFVPGMDALTVNRNVPALGIHGLQGTFSDRLLTLVDGRNADSLSFGGQELERLPLFMEDIAHIEVVRGPAGAAWGANAFNGVVNIITKDPEDCLGVLLATTYGWGGDAYSQARWAALSGPWSWRLSAGGDHRSSTANLRGWDAVTDDDSSRTAKADLAVVHHGESGSTTRLGIGASSVRDDSYEILGYRSPDPQRLDTVRAYAKHDAALGEDVHGTLHWYGSYLRTDRPSVYRDDGGESGLDAQVDLTGLPGHRLSLGAEARLIHLDVSPADGVSTIMLEHHTYDEQRLGVFAIDRWTIARPLTWENQVRGDWYSGTGGDWSGRTALLWSLDGRDHHVLRLAAAKSYRTPLPVIRDPNLARPVLGNPFLILAIQPMQQKLENEQSWSYELGYTGRLSPLLTVRADTFWQRYTQLVSYPSNFDLSGFPVTVVNVSPVNSNGARAWGGELEMLLDTRWGSGSLWYSFNRFLVEREENIRAMRPAQHKAGALVRLPLPGLAGWSLNGGYRYASTTHDLDNLSAEPTEAYSLVDLNVAWQLPHKLGEASLGAWDLLDQTAIATKGTGSFTVHEGVGRQFYARLQLTY